MACPGLLLQVPTDAADSSIGAGGLLLRRHRSRVVQLSVGWSSSCCNSRVLLLLQLQLGAWSGMDVLSECLGSRPDRLLGARLAGCLVSCLLVVISTGTGQPGGGQGATGAWLAALLIRGRQVPFRSVVTVGAFSSSCSDRHVVSSGSLLLHHLPLSQSQAIACRLDLLDLFACPETAVLHDTHA